MRYSLLFTLAKKHKTSTSKIIRMIGSNTCIFINNGNNKLKQIASFLASSTINNKKNSCATVPDFIPSFKKLEKPFIQNSLPKTLYHECQKKNCTKNNVKIFHFRAIHKKISLNNVMTPLKMRWAKIVEAALRKKQIALCNKHHLAIYTGKLFLEDLETNSKSFKLLNSEGLDVKF
jgi:hypothetical protein